jgi:hypothetical protein
VTDGVRKEKARSEELFVRVRDAKKSGMRKGARGVVSGKIVPGNGRRHRRKMVIGGGAHRL